MIFVRGIGVCVHTEDSTVGCPELVVVVPLRFDAQIVVIVSPVLEFVPVSRPLLFWCG
jgi:hypothetical protein